MLDIVTLENVLGIMRVSLVTGKSDSDHIRQRLEYHRYWTTVIQLVKTQLGALAARDRWWLVAIRNLIGDPEAIDDFFHDTIRACILDGLMFEHDACIYFDSDVRERRCLDLGLPSLSGTGVRKPRRGEKEEPGWKDVHYDYFLKLGVKPWPPVFSSASHISLDGLRPREQQVQSCVTRYFRCQQRRFTSILM